MGKGRSVATSWMRGLFGGSAQVQPPHPGSSTRTSGRRALLRAELSIADAVCRTDRDLPGPGESAGTNAFGRPVVLASRADAASVVAVVQGWAMTGLRATGFLRGETLPSALSTIRRAVDQRVPFVLHVTLDGGHDAWHAVADTGACMWLARDLQHAVDLTLLARCIAEEALTPVLVAVEEGEIDRAVADVRLESAEAVGEIVGDAGASVDCPTPAQSMLFGPRRRRVPRWFDPERPTAHGAAPDGAERAARAAGRRVFFDAHTASAIERAAERVSALTGRPLSALDGPSGRAKHLLLLQGCTGELARAVAAHLRQHERLSVDVVSISQLRPLPLDALRDELAHAESVTVLERLDDSASGTAPLSREVRAATGRLDGRSLSASYVTPCAAGIAELFRNMTRREGGRDGLRLVPAARKTTGEYPKREALEQRLRRDYPGLGDQLLVPQQVLDVRPSGSRTIALHHDERQTTDEELEALAGALVRAAGPSVRGSSRALRPGCRELLLNVGAQPLANPGGGVPVDVALIAAADRDPADHPFGGVARQGWVVLATTSEPAETWAGLPASWRAAVRRGELRCAVAVGGVQALTRVAVAIVSGKLDDVREIPWRELPEATAPTPVSDVPLAVRRFERQEATHDSVARFWGEYAEPRSRGAHPLLPDPYLALGGMPAATSTFVDRTEARARVPLIDAQRCTGCGHCWVDCPDSAIAAVALDTASWLDEAAERAVAARPELAGEATDKLRRTHKQLATRIDTVLAKSGADVPAETEIREAFDWLVEKMKPAEEEASAMQATFEATLEQLASWPVGLTEPLFHAPHRGQKGDGRWLMLAVDPRTCQGCEICEAVCPDDAIRIVPQQPSIVEAMRRVWRLWEELPDTTGQTISRACDNPDVGPLASVLLSRHCLYSVAGGDHAEPGSGERLAVRHVAAVIEYQMQRRFLDEVERLKELGERLASAIQEALGRAAAVEDLVNLDTALDTVSAGAPRLGRLLGQLEELGERNDVDLPRLRRLVRIARDVEAERLRLTEGAGRARFGLVIAGHEAEEWAAGFPRNPFSVPLAVAPDGAGADLASGVAEGLVARQVVVSRLLRMAELALEDPADLPTRERAIAALTGEELTERELAGCAPTIVLGTVEELAGTTALSRLLTGRLPIVVVLLDGRDLTAGSVDPSRFGLAHRQAFVLSASIAAPDHLFEGLTAALGHGGPALIHVHAPSPRRHGYSARDTVSRARDAVVSRTHPLLRYDPRAEGVFGTRLSLEGNPDADGGWSAAEQGRAITPAHWARGEARFEDLFTEPAEDARLAAVEDWSQDSSDVRDSTTPTVPGPDGRGLVVGGCLPRVVLERRANWRTLQELAGVVTPFTDAVRRELTKEVAEQHGAELETLREEYEARLQRLEADQDAAQAARLRARLLQLAGLDVPPGSREQEETPS